jgi:hypothetical protein
MLGVMLGSLLTTGLGLTADLYNRDGAVQAPRGSVQQYDYFRQRQLFLDVAAMRREIEAKQSNANTSSYAVPYTTNPCAK